jgi:hypothetical protein
MFTASTSIGTQDNTSFECSVAGQPFACCRRSPLVYRTRRGRHSLVVETIDPLGKTGKPVRRFFRVVRRTPRSASRHLSHSKQDGDARVAHAMREEGPINSTTTQEVNR